MKLIELKDFLNTLDPIYNNSNILLLEDGFHGEEYALNPVADKKPTNLETVYLGDDRGKIVANELHGEGILFLIGAKKN